MFRKIRVVLFTAFGALLLGVTLPYYLFTGPRDLDMFPPPETSPYLLPWPAGIAYFCVQGVRGVVSHRGRSEFGFDFFMPVGSDISAAREGVVTRVVVEHDGHGYQWPNNVILIEHDDGTVACYAHLMRHGNYVEEGDRVARGQIIGASGNVGNSMMPHLHFHVTDPVLRETIPVSFADVRRHRGVPRMFRWYTSDNRAQPLHMAR